MTIVADENILQVKEAFCSFGKVILFNGIMITKELLYDADVLLVRSVTKVNKELLEGTGIKFIGTATIGTDHIDINYLKQSNIFFVDAAGCNAYSVAEYVLCAITNLFVTNKLTFKDKTLAVVGYGNIGTKVARFAESLGFKVLINDPPLQRKTDSSEYCSLDEALTADVITFHVPLNLSGVDKTYHLIDESNLAKIKSGSILINTSRGPVVDNQLLKKRLIEKKDLFTVLDVWENEPNIDKVLLSLTDIATAHIAGYSLEGKLNGTLLIYQKFCEYLDTNPAWQLIYPKIENQSISFDGSKSIEEILNEIFRNIYDINYDSELLKMSMGFEESDRIKHFDSLRKNYRVRREFKNFQIKTNFPYNELKNKLEALRLTVI